MLLALLILSTCAAASSSSNCFVYRDMVQVDPSFSGVSKSRMQIVFSMSVSMTTAIEYVLMRSKDKVVVGFRNNCLQGDVVDYYQVFHHYETNYKDCSGKIDPSLMNKRLEKVLQLTTREIDLKVDIGYTTTMVDGYKSSIAAVLPLQKVLNASVPVLDPLRRIVFTLQDQNEMIQAGDHDEILQRLMASMAPRPREAILSVSTQHMQWRVEQTGHTRFNVPSIQTIHQHVEELA